MQAQIAAGCVDFEIGASKLPTKFLQGATIAFGRMLRANSPLAGLKDEIATWSRNASPPTKLSEDRPHNVAATHQRADLLTEVPQGLPTRKSGLAPFRGVYF
jgi:hypothetical protein